jgi:hypothetical protein
MLPPGCCPLKSGVGLARCAMHHMRCRGPDAFAIGFFALRRPLCAVRTVGILFFGKLILNTVAMMLHVFTPVFGSVKV